MTFRHIILQNLKFNIKRFLSYLFVNSFVVAVLFLYGSLLFNEILAQDVAMKMAEPYINAAAYTIVFFSIAFVTYTGIYFVKSRGREFGVYLTLGMTTRDLSRMIRFESLVILAGSCICGLLSGLLLSKLFYLALGKVLGLSDEIYYIGYKTFLLSLGIFLFIFLCNQVFTSIFLRKLSIIQITKASSTKGISKPHPILGCFSIIIFIASLWFYHNAFFNDGQIKEFAQNHPLIGLTILMVGIFGALYFVVAFCIDCVRMLLKSIPSLYNRHILILANLSHRFNAYKISLYMVSLLIAAAIFFMGFGLSIYSYTMKTIDEYLPFDYMVESSGDINRITSQELQVVVSDNGGTLEHLSALEFIPDVNYRDTPDRFVNNQMKSMLISESEFNRHMGLTIDVAPDELVIVYNIKGLADETINYDTVITIEPWRQGMERADAFRQNPAKIEAFISKLGDTQRLVYNRNKTTSMYYNFINSYGNVEFVGFMANIVDDSVYKSIKAQRDTIYLFNFKNGDGDKIHKALLDILRKKNNADSSLWSNSEVQFADRDKAESLRPIYKAERFAIKLRMDGFLLFAMTFLGFLFLLSSSIVLYYKVATDIDEEKEQASLLTRIGLTTGEYKSYLSTHLAIVFFTPMVIGGFLGLYLIISMLFFTVYVNYLISRVIIMYSIFIAFDILFYMSLKNKFMRGVGLYKVD